MEITVGYIAYNGGKFDRQTIIDSYKSLIWTERHNGSGDFELEVALEDLPSDFLELLDTKHFKYNYDICFEIRDSKKTMIMNSIEINYDSESGYSYLIKGDSLESILNRRIVWYQTMLNGNLETCIIKLLNENIINPTEGSRQFPKFYYESPDQDVQDYISKISIDTQFTGDNLYDVICNLCDVFDLGFEIYRKYKKTKDPLDYNSYCFRLIRGKNRSYNQTNAPYTKAEIENAVLNDEKFYRDNVPNSYVIFSKKFDNLLSFNYLFSNKEIKTKALVAGEGEGSDRKTVMYPPSASGGIRNIFYYGRKELFVDARDLSSDTYDGTLTPAEYEAVLSYRGAEKLAECGIIESIDCDFDFNGVFKIDEDYFLGDIVQADLSPITIKPQLKIVEKTISDDQNGTLKYCTMDFVDIHIPSVEEE